jgi:hypothetical protein
MRPPLTLLSARDAVVTALHRLVGSTLSPFKSFCLVFVIHTHGYHTILQCTFENLAILSFPVPSSPIPRIAKVRGLKFNVAFDDTVNSEFFD